jgi:hypothetical protein
MKQCGNPLPQELAASQRLLIEGTGGAEGQALGRQLADALEEQIERLERCRHTRLRALAQAVQ